MESETGNRRISPSCIHPQSSCEISIVDSGDAIQQLSAGFVSRYNQPSVTMANNGAPLTGFVDELCIEEDPRMGSCLTQKITFKF